MAIVISNFVLKPLPDLISQLRDKILEWPGDVAIPPTYMHFQERLGFGKVQYLVVATPCMYDEKS